MNGRLHLPKRLQKRLRRFRDQIPQVQNGWYAVGCEQQRLRRNDL